MTFSVNIKSPQADNELSTRTQKMHPILGLLYKIISVVSVASIIASVIGIGQYQPCLAYRQFVLTLPTDIWYSSMNYGLMLVIFSRISIVDVLKIPQYTSKCQKNELNNRIIGSV